MHSVVNTEFFVDNCDYVDAYRGIKDWKLGSLEPGEFSEAAAYRELQEETGISRREMNELV